MSPEWFINELKQKIEQVPKGEVRREAIAWIEQRLGTKRLEGEDEMGEVWATQTRSSPSVEHYKKNLFLMWTAMGCVSKGAPYVVRGMLRRLSGEGSPFPPQSLYQEALAKAFLDEEHCPGAHGLTDAEKAKLKAIRDRAPPPAPKP